MAAIGGTFQGGAAGFDARPVRPAMLPIAALVVFAGFTVLALAVAGNTLGYDFLAYHAAAARLLNGGAGYDLGYDAIGEFGLFLYPPTFLPLVLPFGALDPMVATWAWIALLLAAFGVGVALMPVPRAVKWWIVLLAGMSWPFVYSIKLGQVGPLLFLSFAAGWRWMDRPGALGLSAAAGTAVKIQPVLLLFWAMLTGRWRAVAWGVAVVAGLAVLAVLVAGLTGWLDFAVLMGQLTDPITAERNVAPAAVLYRMGAPLETAQALQVVNAIAVLLLVVATASRANAQASFLVAVVASQMVWPVVWEHYAMLLLLPVAYLLSIGWRCAAIIPLATATVLIALTPAIVYPLAFYATLLATMAAGWQPALVHRAAKPSFA
jgi:alpha-1,2-mannosyltransferase